MGTVYKYRQLWGIAEYKIIEGEFGDNTLPSTRTQLASIMDQSVRLRL